MKNITQAINCSHSGTVITVGWDLSEGMQGGAQPSDVKCLGGRKLFQRRMQLVSDRLLGARTKMLPSLTVSNQIASVHKRRNL